MGWGPTCAALLPWLPHSGLCPLTTSLSRCRAWGAAGGPAPAHSAGLMQRGRPACVPGRSGEGWTGHPTRHHSGGKALDGAGHSQICRLRTRHWSRRQAWTVLLPRHHPLWVHRAQMHTPTKPCIPHSPGGGSGACPVGTTGWLARAVLSGSPVREAAQVPTPGERKVEGLARLVSGRGT